MTSRVEHLLYFEACIIDNVMSFGSEDFAGDNLAAKFAEKRKEEF